MMAQRRMFDHSITASDRFIDMSKTAQLLYFHLGMEADDEGFIGNAKMLFRAYGADEDDIDLLIAKNFLIRFYSGVFVITHWNQNNSIRADRKKPTKFIEEKAQLILNDDGIYSLGRQLPADTQASTKWQPLVSEMSAQVRLGKVRLGEVSQGQPFGDDDNNQINQNTREKDIDAVLKKANEVFGNLNNVQVHALENLYKRYETSPGLLMDAIIKMANNDIANISYLTKTAETLYQEEQAMLNTIRTE